jgi:ATP-binding cassette subfamily C (CFTR/MRP) protein 1
MAADRPISTSLDVALRLSNVTFRWAAPQDTANEKISIDSGSARSVQQDSTFSLDHLNLEVPRGKLVALVGRVGSGKSSLLQGVSKHAPVARLLLTLRLLAR